MNYSSFYQSVQGTNSFGQNEIINPMMNAPVPRDISTFDIYKPITYPVNTSYDTQRINYEQTSLLHKSPERRPRSPSPYRYRIRSPERLERMKSPLRWSRSRSPRRWTRSRSPDRWARSRSPDRRARSRSPDRRIHDSFYRDFRDRSRSPSGRISSHARNISGWELSPNRSPYRGYSGSRSPWLRRERTPLRSKRPDWLPSDIMDSDPNRPSSFSELYKEMNEQDKLRKELEEERRRIYENNPALLQKMKSKLSVNGSERVVNPLFSQSNSNYGSEYNNSDYPIPSNSSYLGSFSDLKTPIFDKTTENLNDSISRETRVNFSGEKSLSPGNYLIVYWDAYIFLHHRINYQFFCSLGLCIPHGIEAEFLVAPNKETISQISTYPHIYPYTPNSFGWNYINPINKKVTSTVDEIDVLSQFISYLEQGIKRVRPQYDGVILLSYGEIPISFVFKALKHHSLWSKFTSIVKGVGDVSAYLASEQPQNFPNTESLDFRNAIQNILGYRISPLLSVLENSKAIKELHETLLGGPVNYSNFIQKNVHSINSNFVHKIAFLKTQTQKEKDFFTLRKFMEKETEVLTESDIQLVGIYKTSNKSTLQNKKKCAIYAYINILIQNDLDFDVINDIYKFKGVEELELKLRSFFLTKLGNELKSVVLQTMTFTKAVIKFFVKSDEQSDRHKVVNSANQVFMDGYISFKISFFQACKKAYTLNDRNAVYNNILRLFKSVDLNHDKLVQVYLAHRATQAKTRQKFREDIFALLRKPYAEAPKMALTLEQIINTIVIYLGTSYDRLLAEKRASEKKPIVLKGYQFDVNTSVQFDQIKNDLLYKPKVTFMKKLVTLENFKLVMKRKFQTMIAPSVRDPETYAMEMATYIVVVLASSKYTHFSLNERYKKGYNNFKLTLESIILLNLPGLSQHALIKIISLYFKSLEQLEEKRKPTVINIDDM